MIHYKRKKNDNNQKVSLKEVFWEHALSDFCILLDAKFHMYNFSQLTHFKNKEAEEGEFSINWNNKMKDRVGGIINKLAEGKEK